MRICDSINNKRCFCFIGGLIVPRKKGRMGARHGTRTPGQRRARAKRELKETLASIRSSEVKSSRPIDAATMDDGGKITFIKKKHSL